MRKNGLQIDIPGFGSLDIRSIVTDYTGTLSCGGKIAPGVQERLLRLEAGFDLHVLTSDTFGTVRFELANIPAGITVLEGANHHFQKENFVLNRVDPSRTAAFGNGLNDARMLAAVRQAGGLAVAVDTGEGCAVEAVLNAHLLVHGAANAFDLLLEPMRLKAGLRY
jgi:soluble P-type ATPase